MATYKELLEREEWKRRRQEIIKSQNNFCGKCGIDKGILGSLLLSIERHHLPYLSFTSKEGDNPIRYHARSLATGEPDIYSSYYHRLQNSVSFLNFNPNSTVDLVLVGSGILGYCPRGNHLFKLRFEEEVEKALLNINNSEIYGFFYPSELRLYTIVESNYIFDQMKHSRKGFPDLLGQLQVHHKYYINGYFPWEYDADALIALCSHCHTKEHQENQIPIYSSIIEKGNDDVSDYFNSCPKCNGTGFIPEYNYYQSGVCFKCNGTGDENLGRLSYQL